MKKTIKLIPAIVMLLVSAILVSTSTYAWFSMNTQVTATGMQVKAKAEGGIVIANADKGSWNASATAKYNTATEVIPTSTKSLSVWFHAKSDDANNAKVTQAAGNYTTISATKNNLSVTDGVGYWAPVKQASGTYAAGVTYYNSADTIQGNLVDTTSFVVGTTDVSTYYVLDTANKNPIYLVNSFFIKSSAEQMTGAALYINEVTVTGTTGSTELDKALRVAITLGGTTSIIAPLTGADTTYDAGGSASSTDTGAVTCIAPGTKNTLISNNLTIPAYSADGLEAVIYVYFEGEDENCKSANLTATLDTLVVTVQFGTTTIA